MKKIKFEVLLRDTIVKYSKFNLHLSKCNSDFLIQMLLENNSLSAASCDFGTWYFSRGSEFDLPSINEIEKPYIKVFALFKKLENQFQVKLSKMDRLKNKIPFVKAEPSLITAIVDNLQLNCLLLISALKNLESDYELFKVTASPIHKFSTPIYDKIEANLATIESYSPSKDIKYLKIGTETRQAIHKASINENKENTLPKTLEVTSNQDNNEPDPLFESKLIDTEIVYNELKNSPQKIKVEADNISTPIQKTDTKPPFKKGDIETSNFSNSRKEEWISLMEMKRMMDNLN